MPADQHHPNRQIVGETTGHVQRRMTSGVKRPSVGVYTAGAVRTVLPNGLTVLVQPMPDAPAAAIVTRVRAGFFDEPDHWAGISHVLEHMFFKGTPTRGVGDIARATKSAGGYLNAATSYDYTTYYAVLPARGCRPRWRSSRMRSGTRPSTPTSCTARSR